MAEKNAEKVWKTMAWATYDGDVLVVKALRSILRWRSPTWWPNRSASGMRVDPIHVSRWKHQWCFSQRGRGVGYSYGQVGWRGKRLGTRNVPKKKKHPPKKDEVIMAPLKMARRHSKHLLKKATRSSQQKQTRELDPTVRDVPGRGTGIQVEIRGDSKTVEDWIHGIARQRSACEAVGEIQRQLRDRWSKAVNMRVRKGDWAVHIFREHNKEGDAWAEQKVLVAVRERVGGRGGSGLA